MWCVAFIGKALAPCGLVTGVGTLVGSAGDWIIVGGSAALLSMEGVVGVMLVMSNIPARAAAVCSMACASVMAIGMVAVSVRLGRILDCPCFGRFGVIMEGVGHWSAPCILALSGIVWVFGAPTANGGVTQK